MQPEENICLKFPSVLREKLLNHEIEFPEDTQFAYEKLYVYRAVEREEDDFRDITLEDFRSYAQLGKKPKRPRGASSDLETDPHYYGVSSFFDRKIVEQLMRFPNPHKKMAEGYVYQEGGPQHTELRRGHVCWWLYENTDVSGFTIKKE